MPSFNPLAKRLNALSIGYAAVPATHKKCGEIYKPEDFRFEFLVFVDETKALKDFESAKMRVLIHIADPLDEMGHDAPDTAEQIGAQERQDSQVNGLRLLGYNDKLQAVGQRLAHASGTRKKRRDTKQDAHVIEVEVPKEQDTK